ncbi:MAG TPA: protein kinase [Steroidobacteraceae bacterium]|jgi:serine/threonine-protein kinase|nr:protein kinase [Steroidobacteraceae bacterium]
MPITAADWKRLSPLLNEALDLPPAECAVWLATLPPEHADLRQSLAAVLAQRSAIETGDFLDRLPEFSAAPAALALGPDTVVGPYRLLREIGAGGSASVWLAERVDGSIQRKVALKLPHLGLVDRGIEERIAREREILAGLEHPNIARLYDAGVDERGRPYLALEYVDGVPPDEYCRVARLDLREKLALFLDILRAVAFAHARLIVHRDLKPNNILIAEGRQVRLLDFGIARLLQPELSLRAQITAQNTIAGAAALTPAYAAPEQFAGSPVTVATDVYSLGVILFELLSGSSPYKPEGRSLGAYEQAVLHGETALVSRAARPAEARVLRGDLDAVVAKALEKDPADRYASVEAFANDIERHLAQVPILARRRSFAYVARKFARRNALALAIAAVTITALTVSLGIAAWQWRDAERQRAMAVERLADSEAAAQFTSTVLIEGMQPGESLTFEQLIARSEEIAKQTGRDDLRARIFATQFLADWYRANGLNRRAEEILTRTIDSLPPDARLLGSTLRCARAYTWSQLARGEEAVAALAGEIALNDGDPSVAADCLLQRARLATGSGDARNALDFAEAALARYEEAGVESIYGRTDLLKALGAAYALRDDFPAAHAKYREVLKLFDTAGRGRSRPAAHAHDEWASVWMNAGNPLRALQEIDIAWTMTRELSPNAQPTDSRVGRRARILGQLGLLAESAAEWQQALELSRARGNLANVAGAHIGQAEVATLQERFEEAQHQLQLAEAALRESAVAANDVLNSRFALTNAALLAARGNSRGATAELTRALAQYRAQDCCRAHMALSLAMRGELALRDGRVSDAATDARDARELAPQIANDSFSRFTGRAWFVTGLIYENQGKRREARDAFANAAAQFAGSVGEKHGDTLRAREALQRMS